MFHVIFLQYFFFFFCNSNKTIIKIHFDKDCFPFFWISKGSSSSYLNPIPDYIWNKHTLSFSIVITTHININNMIWTLENIPDDLHFELSEFLLEQDLQMPQTSQKLRHIYWSKKWNKVSVFQSKKTCITLCIPKWH